MFSVPMARRLGKFAVWQSSLPSLPISNSSYLPMNRNYGRRSFARGNSMLAAAIPSLFMYMADHVAKPYSQAAGVICLNNGWPTRVLL